MIKRVFSSFNAGAIYLGFQSGSRIAPHAAVSKMAATGQGGLPLLLRGLIFGKTTTILTPGAYSAVTQAVPPSK